MHLQRGLAELARCSALQWCYWHKRPVKGRRAQAKAKLRLCFKYFYPSLTSHLLEPTSCIMYDYPAWSRWQDSGAWRRRSHLRRWPPSSPLSYFSLFFPPQFKRRWLPPSGHLSHPETVMNHLSYQFDGTISEITITVQCIWNKYQSPLIQRGQIFCFGTILNY